MGSLKKHILKFNALFIVFTFLIVSGGTWLSPLPVQAQQSRMEKQSSAFRDSAGFTANATIGGVIATAIKAVLGFLAIVFIIIMIINGFKWMTAGGNEDKIKEAKQSIRNAIIGLIIVVAAYSITYFVFDVLSGVGGGGGTTGSGGF